jgi:hypothetical protein
MSLTRFAPDRRGSASFLKKASMYEVRHKHTHGQGLVSAQSPMNWDVARIVTPASHEGESHEPDIRAPSISAERSEKLQAIDSGRQAHLRSLGGRKRSLRFDRHGGWAHGFQRPVPVNS